MGTVSNARAICPACNSVLLPVRVRNQLSNQKGGATCLFDNNGKRVGGSTLLVVITASEGRVGKSYRVSSETSNSR